MMINDPKNSLECIKMIKEFNEKSKVDWSTKMTNNPIEEFFRNAEIACEIAHTEICHLAKGPGNKFRMTIPVNKNDSDIILQEPLDYIKKLLALVRIYREANAWIIKQPRDYVHFAGSKARAAEEKALEIVKFEI